MAQGKAARLRQAWSRLRGHGARIKPRVIPKARRRWPVQCERLAAFASQAQAAAPSPGARTGRSIPLSAGRTSPVQRIGVGISHRLRGVDLARGVGARDFVPRVPREVRRLIYTTDQRRCPAARTIFNLSSRASVVTATRGDRFPGSSRRSSHQIGLGAMSSRPPLTISCGCFEASVPRGVGEVCWTACSPATAN